VSRSTHRRTAADPEVNRRASDGALEAGDRVVVDVRCEAPLRPGRVSGDLAWSHGGSAKHRVAVLSAAVASAAIALGAPVVLGAVAEPNEHVGPVATADPVQGGWVRFTGPQGQELSLGGRC
jgi:hypothetical protein